jgi:hypothetical protein
MGSYRGSGAAHGSEENYETGYGRPPRESQWKPGQSGNPRGRPKKSKKTDTGDIAAMIREELAAEVTVVENGRKLKMNMKRLLVKKLIADAIGGTPDHRLKTVKHLATMGLTQADPEDHSPSDEQIVDFITELARECNVEIDYGTPPSVPMVASTSKRA